MNGLCRQMIYHSRVQRRCRMQNIMHNDRRAKIDDKAGNINQCGYKRRR
jgi:hypothetical protein